MRRGTSKLSGYDGIDLLPIESRCGGQAPSSAVSPAEDIVDRTSPHEMSEAPKKVSTISPSRSIESAVLMAVRMWDPLSSPFVYHEPSARILFTTHRS